MNFPGRKDNGEKEKGFLVQVNSGYDMWSIVYSESDYVQEILSKNYTSEYIYSEWRVPSLVLNLWSAPHIIQKLKKNKKQNKKEKRGLLY